MIPRQLSCGQSLSKFYPNIPFSVSHFTFTFPFPLQMLQPLLYLFICKILRQISGFNLIWIHMRRFKIILKVIYTTYALKYILVLKSLRRSRSFDLVKKRYCPNGGIISIFFLIVTHIAWQYNNCFWIQIV